ncbi:MAG: hypothetical protein GX088_00760 [Clostridia bacterium]|nr:hypothetical protein [Clostridia bacterium]
MREINVDFETIVGAVAHGSESNRWFLDTETGRVFLISVDFYDEELTLKMAEEVKQNPERYIPLPFLTQEDFLDEVRLYSRLQTDNPALAKLLDEAVEKKYTRAQVKKILNREPGQGKKFGDFYINRVRERVQSWLDYQGIKLVE